MNVQMNIRIDEQVKREGDEVFGSLGYSPTQVVRSVWEFAAAHRDAPEIVRWALEEVGDQSPVAGEALLLEASSTCARLREQFGIVAPDTLEDLDYQAIRERAMRERLHDRGLA